MYLPVANDARAGMQTGDGVQQEGETRTARGKPIEVRRVHDRMAVAAHMPRLCWSDMMISRFLARIRLLPTTPWPSAAADEA